MAIKDDILKMKVIQDGLKKDIGRYVQVIPTPGTEKMLSPSDDRAMVDFVPVNKDYLYRVDVWSGPSGDGFAVTAKRDLGDGVLETVTFNMGEFI